LRKRDPQNAKLVFMVMPQFGLGTIMC
jgi:hypothetical protein